MSNENTTLEIAKSMNRDVQLEQSKKAIENFGRIRTRKQALRTWK